MRLPYSLIRAALPLAMLCPLMAHAAWPGGAREQYMNDCVATARQQVDASTATAHCSCGADVIERQFSTAEIQQLMSKAPPPTVELRDRLQKEVSVCRAK
ncbi:hypothetical protein [Pseudomonas sp. DC3200b2]|uniref:hypothetical protein n=1 Tax=Pseudomonas sp. DC3200b2 TaxID=2804669 RepID=UPI003CF0BE91